MEPPRKFLCISCNVFYREVCAAIARSPHQIDVTFLPKGLHNIACAGMRDRLQQKMDQLNDPGYEAILWAYGMCNHGLVGVQAREHPLVIPRAHDCITVFFGSQERHLDYFKKHPGTYIQTPGWIERDENPEELDQLAIPNQLGMNKTYAELVEEYGEDNAQFLYEELYQKLEAKGHGQITYIDTGIANDDYFADLARQKADERGWTYDRQQGNLHLLTRLFDGHWGERDFLVVPPGHRIEASYDENIMRAVPAG